MKERLMRLWALFAVFFKIGAFTFGGGYAMIPLIEREVVDEKEWITGDDMLDIVAIAESTPGPIAINTATFVGFKTAGVLGAVAATFGTVLPSFIIIAVISTVLAEFREVQAVKFAFAGIRAGVLALLVKAVVTMYKKMQKIGGRVCDHAVGTRRFAVYRHERIVHCHRRGADRIDFFACACKGGEVVIFWQLFYTFFTVGLFTFGGGYAMLPLIQERVIANGWLEPSAIIDFIAVSESTPGPFAINISTYVGMEMGGVLGAVCATAGVVLPSLIVIMIVARCFEAFKNNRIVEGCMTGLRPVVVGLIGSAVLSMALEVFFADGFSLGVFVTYPFLCSLAVFTIMTVLAFKKAHPIVIILLSAGLGIAAGYAQMLWQ